jgi:hypothetical protein
MLRLTPMLLSGAPVPFKSSAVNCVMIPSGDAMTLSLQNRGSKEM